MEVEVVKKLKAMLRTGQLDKAKQILYEIIQSITEKLMSNSVENVESIGQFNEIITVIYQAMECEDVILLCDMIEYELYPFIKKI